MLNAASRSLNEPTSTLYIWHLEDPTDGACKPPPGRIGCAVVGSLGPRGQRRNQRVGVVPPTGTGPHRLQPEVASPAGRANAPRNAPTTGTGVVGSPESSLGTAGEAPAVRTMNVSRVSDGGSSLGAVAAAPAERARPHALPADDARLGPNALHACSSSVAAAPNGLLEPTKRCVGVAYGLGASTDAALVAAATAFARPAVSWATAGAASA